MMTSLIITVPGEDFRDKASWEYVEFAGKAQL